MTIQHHPCFSDNASLITKDREIWMFWEKYLSQSAQKLLDKIDSEALQNSGYDFTDDIHFFPFDLNDLHFSSLFHIKISFQRVVLPAKN